MKRFAVVLVLCFLLTFAGSRTAVALTPTPSPTPIHLGGMDVPWDASYLDLSAIRSEDIPEVMAVLEGLPYLRSVKLTDGDGASPWSIQQAWTLMQDRPELQVEYTANAFGVSFSLTDEVVSFSNIDLGDRVEELKALLPYMTGVGRLDMEYCQIPDEQMAALREEFPAPKIVWRVFMGKYSCRTDAIMIRFSDSSEEQRLRDKDVYPLIYCNEMRYLDLGHNALSSAYFAAYMPALEVCILAVEHELNDISALASCPKLEFLEIFSGRVTDISPLAECKNLKHLNICNNRITDITPLYSLELERLWIAHTFVPYTEIEAYRASFPECEVDYTASDPAAGHWRIRGNYYVPRYALLREQFCYDHLEIKSYSEPPKFE